MSNPKKTNEQLLEEIAALQRQVSELEAQYQAIFEIMENPTILIEEDTIISMSNIEFEKLSGYSKNEIEGRKSWTEFVSENDLKRMKEYHQLRRTDPDAAPKNYSFCFINKAGEIRDVYINVVMVPGTKKSLASFLDFTALGER